MSPDNTVSLELLPDEILDSRLNPLLNPGADPIPMQETDAQSDLRKTVLRVLASSRNPSGLRDMLLDTVEEALLRHYLDSGQFSQRELARMLSISRVTLRKKLDKYGLS